MSDVLGQILGVTEVKTTRTIDLGDCDPAYAGAVFDVWVTPTRAHIQVFVNDVSPLMGRTDLSDAERHVIESWFAATWTNLDLEAVTQIHDKLREVYPAAWSWLIERTLRSINEHRDNLTKN